MINKEKIEKLTYELLLALGEDPARSGLAETPKRVAGMYCELCSGLDEDPKKFVKLFKSDSMDDDIIEITDIPVCSLCEHHLLPFKGKAHIKYIPKNGVIMGISKFARIVQCFAKKPQVQENLTAQIADFLIENLNARAVEVTLECEHTCMTVRGVKATGAITRTTAMRGNF